MDWNDTMNGLVTALGLGLMIGVVRERRHQDGITKAGSRTHALVAVLGAVSWWLGMAPYIATMLVVGALVVIGYFRTAEKDPGLTGEVAVLITLLLAGLAQKEPALAAGLGALCAILMYAKEPLHRLSRELIREGELQDALMIAAAALVIMPLLPAGAVDPWGVLRPTMLWRIVVLVMAVGMLGHIAQRAVGARWGLPIAGFFSGLASSTAAVASFGDRARATPALTTPSAAAALLSNLASLILLAGVIGAVSPPLLRVLAWPLAAGGLALALVALAFLKNATLADEAELATSARAFKISHALMIASAIATVLLLSAWLHNAYGDTSVIVAAMLVALVEVHAAAVSVAQIGHGGGMLPENATWGMIAVLTSSALAKTVLAFFAGGGAYGRRVAGGLVAMAGAAAATLLLL